MCFVYKQLKMGSACSSCNNAKDTLGTIGEKTSIVVTALDKNKDAIMDTMEALHVPQKVVQGTAIGFVAAEVTGLAKT
jgi:hypothetical protein